MLSWVKAIRVVKVLPVEDIKKQIQEDEYRFPYHWFLEDRGLKFGDVLHYQGYIELAIKLLSPLNGKRILDAGCGDGRVSYELIKNGADVFGIDFSRRAIEFAKLLVTEAEFHVGDLKALADFKDEFFNGVVMLEVLEHMPVQEMSACLKEINRVLIDGGKFVVSVPSDRVKLIDKHYKHFSEHELKELLENNFRVEKVVGYHRKSLVYSFLVKIFDNQFWISKKLLSFVFKNYIQTCRPSNGVMLLALCSKIKRWS